jgi:GH24 family phage-related lysozyme (muramidase)
MTRELIKPAKQLISGVEKCALIPYQGGADPEGVLTTGWGHVIKSNEPHLLKPITQEQADALVQRDIESHTKYIQSDIGAKIVLDDWVFGAFASLAYNNGPRTFSSAPSIVGPLRQGNVKKALLAMWKWNKSGKPLKYRDGLFYRRLQEMVFALDRTLVPKPDHCKQANALIVRLAQHGDVTEMRTFFHANHRKELCLVCQKK